jgi:hypothetical protein
MVKLQDSGVPSVATFDLDGRQITAAVRINFDGIEYVGRLWFAPSDATQDALPDRGAFPGRSTGEVVEAASRLTAEELRRRYGRAIAEKRRYVPLRVTTDDIIAKIRYMNHVAVAMRSGMLDSDGAGQEMQLIQQQLHALVDQLGDVVGIEV